MRTLHIVFFEYNYSSEKYELNICYFNNDPEKELEPTNTKSILMDNNQAQSFLSKLGYDDNREINYDRVDKYNSFLYDFIFVKDGEDIGLYYKIFNKMKETYSNGLDYFNQIQEEVKRKIDNNISNYMLFRDVSMNNIVNRDFYLRIYNVGQGNCSALYSMKESSPYIIFDMGSMNKLSNASLKTMLNNLDGIGYIVISHFDEDHYNFYKQLPKKAYQRIFIVHEFPKTMKGRLAGFIDFLKINKANVYTIKNDSIKSVSDYEHFGLFDICQGLASRRNPKQSTIENTHSLVSIIKINDSKAIIPGDALEDEFVLADNQVFKYGIISHHGCKNYNEIPYYVYHAFLPVLDPYHENYHHPQKRHILKYDNVYRFGRDKCKIYDDKELMDDDITFKKTGDYIDWKF